MPETPATPPDRHDFEGDYRPAGDAPSAPVKARVEAIDAAYLVGLTDALNTTLDLETLLNRTAELVRAVIH